MTEKWKDKLTDQLCQLFYLFEDMEEAYCFLEDVATIGRLPSPSVSR